MHNRTVEAMGADTEPATEAKRIAKTALATRLSAGSRIAATW